MFEVEEGGEEEKHEKDKEKKMLIAQRDHYKKLASVWEAWCHPARQDKQIPPQGVSTGRSSSLTKAVSIITEDK